MPLPMPKPPSEGEAEPAKATRQCWECLKRRLVCDRNVPQCKKCGKAGKECPGYGDVKPLQWVAVRELASRRRKTSSSPESQTTIGPVGASTEVVPRSGNQSTVVLLNSKSMDEQTCELASKVQGLFGGAGKNPTDRNDARLVFSEGVNYIFQRMLRGEEDKERMLARMVGYLERENVPRYTLLNETSDVVQAVHYYNTCIYPQTAPVAELAHIPTIMTYFPVAALHLMTQPIHSVMVCWSLNHRINALPPRESRQLAKDKWLKTYDYRGAAIKQLSESIANEKMRCSDNTITGIYMLLCLDLQMSISENWRVHSDGLLRIFGMRGGMMNLFRSAPHMRSALALFNWMAIYSNTMSPPLDQIVPAESLDQHLSDTIEMYTGIFSFFLSPAMFLLDTVKINNLRARAAACLEQQIDVDDTMFAEAEEILANIEIFDCEQWAHENHPTFHLEWALIGRIFQAATAIYCIMSLRSIGIFPNGTHYIRKHIAYGDRLIVDLKSALPSPRLRFFLMWPLVVAGVEAGYKSSQTRRWAEEKLEELTRALGTRSPLKARVVLKAYWDGDARGWDQCFGKANCFVL